MTFAEAIENLRRYDDEPVAGQAPTLYVADPWAPSSEAVIQWSSAKGGVPLGHNPVLFHLTTVRAALDFFGSEYDEQLARGETPSLCRKLATHIAARNARRVPHDTKF
jgi:hypothetical protein